MKKTIRFLICGVLAVNMVSAQAPKKGGKTVPIAPAEDSASVLVSSLAKNDFAKKFKNAKDVKWSNLTAVYMVEFNDEVSAADKNGMVLSRNHQMEYTRGGKDDGKWQRTIITYSTSQSIKAGVNEKVLANIEAALKKKGEKISDVESVKCADKCIGQGDERYGEVKYIESEGYYVHGSKTYADHTYVFNKLGELYSD